MGLRHEADTTVEREGLRVGLLGVHEHGARPAAAQPAEAVVDERGRHAGAAHGRVDGEPLQEPAAVCVPEHRVPDDGTAVVGAHDPVPGAGGRRDRLVEGGFVEPPELVESGGVDGEDPCEVGGSGLSGHRSCGARES